MTIHTASWMDLVPGSKLLSELSIPGTHDSGSRTPASEAARLTTQNRTILEQLLDGIRFLDIRVGYTNGAFALYHEDVSVGLSFQGVLADCKAFLAASPRETIIMSVKMEDDAPTSGNPEKQSFSQRFDLYATADENAGLFYLEDRIPLLSEVRGKVVLFRRFELGGASAEMHGINAFDGFPSDTTGTIQGPPKLRIQDAFAQSGENTRTRDEKWAEIAKLLDKASGPDSSGKVLFVNFASAAGIVDSVADHDFPDDVARDINPRLAGYFSAAAHQQGRFGIVVTDFETAELNKLIIGTNLSPRDGYWIATRAGIPWAFGLAEEFSMQQVPANIVAIAPRLNGTGYYLLGTGGKVYPFGTATHEGEGIPAGTQAVSIAVKPTSADSTGRLGYWILSANGKVRSYNAVHHGEIEDGTNLQAAAIVATPDGGGYWILASNGRIHNYGNADHFEDQRDAGQVATAMARTANGRGYWILASNGAVHAFGNAVHYGQDKVDGTTARAIAATRDGTGYWVLSTDGNVTAYGSAQYAGRVRHTEVAVGIAADLRAPPAAPAAAPAGAAAQATAATGA